MSRRRLGERRMITPAITSRVPIIFCNSQISPKKITAKIDEKIGEILTIGEEWATPMCSMSIYPEACPIAGVKSSDRGTKRINSSQKIAALVPSEMIEPVMAVECTRPRRTTV